jgi:hypothetical protein
VFFVAIVIIVYVLFFFLYPLYLLFFFLLCSAAAAAAVALLTSFFPALYVLLQLLSRTGLWMFDLCARQIAQETIAEHLRGTYSILVYV